MIPPGGLLVEDGVHESDPGGAASSLGLRGAGLHAKDENFVTEKSKSHT
jgi:hypothetical protein